MRTALFAALACVSFAGAALADDKATIQAQDDKFAAAANRGDVDAIVAMYAPGARVLPGDNTVVTGPGIRTLFTGMVSGTSNLKLTATDVVRLSPTYIREIGVVNFNTKGDKPAAVAASYVVVWHKVGGVWKLWTDIFH